MGRLRDLMTGESKIRYLLWRALKLPGNLTIRLTSGERLNVRPLPADDIETAFEIFVAQVYRPPLPIEADSVKLIVDLGANIGFSGIYLAHRYPKAKIIAFEPHPKHAQIARYNVNFNGFDKSFELVCAAASNCTEEAFLTDKGVCSMVISKEFPGAIKIKILDIFEHFKNTPIDILKIDIEGGEFNLLGDSRFRDLQARVVVLEYHVSKDKPDARDWCQQRLSELGYRVESGAWDGPNNGFLWAYREPAMV